MKTISFTSRPGHEHPYCAAACNICGCTSSRPVIHFPTFEGRGSVYSNVSVVQCKECGVRRRSPEIVDDYEEEYHSPYADQGKAIHSHTLRHFADLMTEMFKGFRSDQERFLDVGCSTGRVLQLARTMGFRVTGLDYSKWAADYCQDLGFETRHGSLLGQWSDGEQFDVVHSSHTIEHVPDPVAYLMEMHRLLAKGGYLMLAFPNYASISRIYWQSKWPIWCLDSHLWQFTLQQMVGMCKQIGFQIVSAEALHGWKLRSKILQAAFDTGQKFKLGCGAQIIAKKI